MLNAITNALGLKSVDGIMATFTKTITDLEAVRAKSEAKASKLQEKARQAVIDSNKASHEAQRATGMIGRLQSLVNG